MQAAKIATNHVEFAEADRTATSTMLRLEGRSVFKFGGQWRATKQAWPCPGGTV
jgi:hypothetical protein